MRQFESERVGPALGIAAILVTFVGIFGAVALSPSFAWGENALSNLGVASQAAGTGTTVLLFNGGLILGGVLGIGFAASLVAVERQPVVRLGAVIFGVAMASMAGVGVFPQDGPYHFEVAFGLYILFTVAAVVFGVGKILDSARREGALSAGLGALNLGIWAVWVQQGGIGQPGLAIPEILGAACIGAWALWQAGRLRTNVR
jgi:hypothetical membrane protein